MQVPQLAPEKPAPHAQSTNLLLATGDSESIGQKLHVAAPVSSAEYLPGSQATQVDDNVAAIANEYAPESQGVHFQSPCPSLYEPA